MQINIEIGLRNVQLFIIGGFSEFGVGTQLAGLR